MSAKAAIKKHGSPAINAITADIAQIDNLLVYQVLDPSKLFPQHKQEALRSINLIKEKQDGRLKCCTVADEHPQRFYA
jgi:hypothetical protein